MNNLISLTIFYAFQIVPERTLVSWYQSRLGLGIVAGIIFGILIGIFHLNRLSRKVNTGNTNSEARRWIIFYLVLFEILLGSALFWDISSYSFNNYHFIGWKDIFIGPRSLLVQSLSVVALFLSVSLTIRFITDCACKHAIIPR